LLEYWNLTVVITVGSSIVGSSIIRGSTVNNSGNG
jgi:hypothetical protein